MLIPVLGKSTAVLPIRESKKFGNSDLGLHQGLGYFPLNFAFSYSVLGQIAVSLSMLPN
jgi:hypothetical protein